MLISKVSFFPICVVRLNTAPALKYAGGWQLVAHGALEFLEDIFVVRTHFRSVLGTILGLLNVRRDKK